MLASPSQVRLAHEHGVDFSTKAVQYAVGQYATGASVPAALGLGVVYSAMIMRGAAQSNKLPVIQWLHALGCPWDMTVTLVAARRAELGILRWLREHGCDWKISAVLLEAARSGNVEMTAWVLQQPDAVCSEDAMRAAARHGHTAICALLHSQHCPWSAKVCSEAAGRGRADTLRWLHEHGCPWDADTIFPRAAASGSIEAIVYLQQQLQQGTEFVLLQQMLKYAGAYNKLAAARWLRQQGAEWPAKLLTSGGVSWTGEALVWARAEGCTSPTQ
jgi:hypothetical protein